MREGVAGYELKGDDRETWRARRVILATGPWPLPALPEPVPTRIKRVAALKAELPVRPGDPIVFFPEDDLFFLPGTDGTAMISFDRGCWDQDPADVDGSLDDGDLRIGLAAVRARSTAAASAVIGGQAFCDRYTGDRLPYVWNSAGSPGLAAIMAGSGSGIRLAPGLAARAVSAVEGKRR
ncbi:FAD-dependent oxidoreductase [Nonomuraea jabiensis]|uniref:FAD-dependent oxidoreductase n=1 Tax=Nonomuraea jabiensis TaxID=882448 RepID=UPI003441FF47